MDQARNNVRRTAAFARRVLCRSLTVVGGVAAGTALAWWLSTATASADVQPLVDEQPGTAVVGVPGVPGLTGVTDVTDAAKPVTAPLKQAVETATEFVQDPPPPPKPIEELREKVKAAAEKFRDRTGTRIEHLPACATGVCLDDQVQDRLYVDDRAASPILSTSQVITPPKVEVAPGVIGAIAHQAAKDRAFADGMSRRGSPAPVIPTLPGLPGWPVPLPPVPAGIPTAGGHGSAGNSFDSHLFAVLPWQNSAFDLARGGIADVADAATFGRPGNQPGVAPD